MDAAAETTACPLTWPEQRRNLVLFACCTGMQYLAGPVLYVGVTQASLCENLGANARTSNLPATLFFAMTAIPAVIAWASPAASALKRNLILCYLISALTLLTIAVALILPIPNGIKVAMIILQGGISGASMPAAIAFLWEIIGRGSDDSRRGLALGLAFGVGPILAVVGSAAHAALLGGNLFGFSFPGLPAPWGFVVLFGAGAPIMLVAALISTQFIIPSGATDLAREPARNVAALLVGVPLMALSVALLQIASIYKSQASELCAIVAGMLAAVALVYHFRSLLSQRVLFVATIVTILVYAGNMIPSNMNLYSESALGASPALYAGPQNMLRFGFKVVAGACLGLILTRTNPRAGVLLTSCLFLIAQLWAMLAAGPWYLLAFGFFGAGELVGVYAPNYIVSASRKSDLRRNLAFVTMLMVPAAPAGYLYGFIVDFTKSSGWTLWGMTSAALGFRLSFLTCALLILSGILVAVFLLPPRPQPPAA